MKSSHLDIDGNLSGGQPLQAVGQWLKAAREQKGESLGDASNITRIDKNYLEALEEGASAKLPSQAYTRGFIRLYAAHLGLSPDEAVSRLNGQPTDTTQPDQPGNRSDPTHLLSTDRQADLFRGTKKLLIPIICAVALATIVFSYMHKKDRKSSSPPSQAVATIPPTHTGPVPATAGTGQLAVKSETPPAAAAVQSSNGEATAEEGIVLRLKAVIGGRLHITIDGSASQEYDLVTGDIIEWKAEKVLLLDLENAASVEGELDGNPLKSFGEAGKAAHLIIRQNGVQRN